MFRNIVIVLSALLISGCEVMDDSYIDPRPQYDAQGNPNFDTHGNYIGCHGIGCSVDDPSDYEDNSQFDDTGEYIGCHGVGCLTDDPE